MRLIPKKEALYLLGVSRATIDRWRNVDGKPPAVKQGILVFYRSTDIDEYITKLPTIGKAHK